MKKTNPYRTGITSQETQLTKSLSKLELITDKTLIVSAKRSYGVGSYDVTAETYKFQSILFNNQVTVENGIVEIEDSADYALSAMKRLFTFISRFKSGDIQNFIEPIEISVQEFSRAYPNESPEHIAALSDLQHLVRIMISLIPESVKIASDLSRIETAQHLSIQLKKDTA